MKEYMTAFMWCYSIFDSLDKCRKDLPILQRKLSDKRHVGLPDLIAPDACRNGPASKADVMAISMHASAGEKGGGRVLSGSGT